MQISHATQAGPGRVNEDYVAAGPDWAVVLDGATPAPGVDSGCRHDLPWLVRQLTLGLSERLTRAGPGALAGLLADAIGQLRDAHAGTCDLSNPDSPSTTVAMARVRGGALEYLVLCDSPILLRRADGPCTLIADDRLAGLPGGPPYSTALVREWRNRPGGFWVASTDPAAAFEAVCGSVDLAGLTDAALFTDGVTRLADWYGYPWPLVLTRLRELGPAGLLGLLRAAERAYPHPRSKQHDDATVAHLAW